MTHVLPQMKQNITREHDTTIIGGARMCCWVMVGQVGACMNSKRQLLQLPLLPHEYPEHNKRWAGLLCGGWLCGLPVVGGIGVAVSGLVRRS